MNVCASCGKPIKKDTGLKLSGAKVFHFYCAYEALKEAREKYEDQR